jgi:uncharacterized protein YfeS
MRNLIAGPAASRGAVSGHHKHFQIMDFFSNPQENAHPKARKLMNEDFYWSPIDEAGPFGSDSGSDAAQGFIEWRKTNKTTSPIKYLGDLLISWGFPFFDWNELDSKKIEEYIQIKANVDDMFQNIDQLKEIMKNTPDDFGKDISDQTLQDLISQSAEGMGGTYLLNIDNAIIGTGFAQFATEGKIDEDLKYLTQTALKRQLLPLLIDRYDNNYKEIRRQVLTKMINVVENSNL